MNTCVCWFHLCLACNSTLAWTGLSSLISNYPSWLDSSIILFFFAAASGISIFFFHQIAALMPIYLFHQSSLKNKEIMLYACNLVCYGLSCSDFLVKVMEFQHKFWVIFNFFLLFLGLPWLVLEFCEVSGEWAWYAGWLKLKFSLRILSLLFLHRPN